MELLRSAHENIENLEKAIALVFALKEHNQKLSVVCDHMIKKMSEGIQE